MTPDPALPQFDQDIELRQVLALGLLDPRSANAFQQDDDRGIPDPTFSPDSIASQARLRARVRDRFAAFERQRRARLVEVTFRLTKERAELGAEIVYESLESGGRRSLDVILG